MANETYLGILQQFGLDLPERQKAESAMRRKAIDDAMEIAGPSDDPRVTAGQRLGAALGGALGQKGLKIGDRQLIRPDDKYAALPEEVRNKYATVSDAKTDFSKWLEDPANKDAKPEDKARTYQEMLIRSAFRNGLEGIGTEMLMQYKDKEATRSKRDLEIEKLGLEVKDRKAKAPFELASLQKVDFYEAGTNNPNATKSGLWDPLTNTVTADGRVYQPHEWISTRPIAPSQMGGGGSGTRLAATPTEMAALRKDVVAAGSHHEKILNIYEMFDTAMKDDAGTFLGDVGRAKSFVNRTITGIEQALAFAAGEDKVAKTELIAPGGKVYDFSTPTSRAKYAADNRKELTAIIEQSLPVGMRARLRKDAAYADQFQAMLMEMIYLRAQVAEGGQARSLSDLDVKNNARTLAATVNDPDSFKRVLFEDARRVNNQVQRRLRIYRPDVIGQAFSEGGLEEYRATYQAVEDYYKQFDGPQGEVTVTDPDVDGLVEQYLNGNN